MSSIFKDFRDLESDQLAEFKTLFVRLGAKKSYYIFLTLILLCDVILLHFATFLNSFSLLSFFYLIAIPIQAITFFKIYSMKDAIYELEIRKKIIRLFAKSILLQLIMEWVLYFGGKEILVI
jgi:4-hydroxybenzoate polyprenyltransferase